MLKNRKLSVLLWGYAVFSLQNLGKNVCLLIARREFWNEAASVHKDMVILGSSSSKCSDSARTIFYAQRRKISQIIFSFQKHNLWFCDLKINRNIFYTWKAYLYCFHWKDDPAAVSAKEGSIKTKAWAVSWTQPSGLIRKGTQENFTAS